MKFKKFYSYLLPILLAFSLFPINLVNSVDSTGSIHGRVKGDCVANVIITIVGIPPTNSSWTGITDPYGMFDSACVLECPGKYRVSASKPESNCQLSEPVEFELSECCETGSSGEVNFISTSPDAKKGRILGDLIGSCIKGVNISIHGAEGTIGGGEFITDDKGHFDSSSSNNCSLPCPGKYMVSASKPGSLCIFSEPQLIELKTCCETGGFSKVEFKSYSSTKYGSIKGKVSGTCLDDVTITISGVPPSTYSCSVKTNSRGTYFTHLTDRPDSENCKLPCPGKYIVTASKPGSDCTFSDPVIIEPNSCVQGLSDVVNFTSTREKNFGYIGGSIRPIISGVKITITADAPESGSWEFFTDLSGDYSTSKEAFDNCILPCPGKYTVSASKEGYRFSAPVKVELKKCCGSDENKYGANFESFVKKEEYGLISGLVAGPGKEGVIITISSLTDNEGPWIYTTDSMGGYTSNVNQECKLPCPGKYLVQATKPGTDLTFTDPVTVDLNKCCSEKGSFKANFVITSTPKSYGYISGYVSGVIKNNVTITITGIAPTTGTYIYQTNSNGFFQSSKNYTDCALPCPGKYSVTASMEGGLYTFSGPYTVDMKNCCGFADSIYKINFTSTKAPVKYGSIIGKVTGIRTNNINIVITGVAPTTGRWSFSTDINGLYDSKCVLVCPGKYLVAINSTSDTLFRSDPVTIDMQNCCGTNNSKYEANFTTWTDLSKLGRIKGIVQGTCVSNVEILIEGISPSSGYWRLKTDSTGAYATSSDRENCIIPCPGKYRITAQKIPAGGCQFDGPFIVELTSCCNSTKDLEVNFTSTSRGAIKGNISGSCKAGIMVSVSTVGVNNLLASTKTDAYGNYTFVDASGNCTLPCPGEYEVRVQAPLELKYICELSGPVKVSLSTCCGDGFGIANFTSKSIKNDKGRIAGTVVGVVTQGVTITIEGISPTQWTKTMTTNYYGNYETGLNTECSVPCPGKYKITASMPGNDQYEFSAPVIVDLSTCCGTKEIQANFTSSFKRKGEISGVVTGDCVSGVTIKISRLLPTPESWILTTDSQGRYSTSNEKGCIIPCPGKYGVEATKPNGNCTFSPYVQVDLKTCCGDGKAIVNFTATKIPQKYGMIYGTVAGDCIKDVTITFTGISPTTGTWSVKTDSSGKYYSSALNACVLPCPGKYTVTASKPGTEYIFSNSVTVDLKSCCGEGLYGKADFTSKIKYGVISGTVSGSIKTGVTITIQGISPIVYTWLITTDSSGKYSSSVLDSCKLPCPGKYTVTASYPSGGHTFSAPVTIDMANCCGTANSNYQADFTSTSIPKFGVITGSVLGSVRTNVTITITGVSPTSGTWVVSTDSSGKYTSSVSNSCRLPCPGKYTVTASYPPGGHTFSAPVSVNMVICCGTTSSGYQANFTSSTIPKKYGMISGVVSGAIKYDVLITITGISPTTGSWSFKTDSSGKYASSSSNSCLLPCPGKYTVTASYLKGGYTFSSPVTIDMVNCCGTTNSNYQANFTSQVKKLNMIAAQTRLIIDKELKEKLLQETRKLWYLKNNEELLL